MRWRGSLSFVLAIAVAACGTFLSIDAAPVVTDQDASPDGARAGDDATGATGSVEESCLRDFAPVEGDLFVTPNGDGDECRQEKPCSLSHALLRLTKPEEAPPTRPTLHLASGEYEADLVLSTDVRLTGGWEALASGTWTRTCKNDVKIRTAKESAAAVTVTNADVELAFLSLATRTATPGETLYGVFATGGRLALRHVAIEVGDGGDGAEPRVTGAQLCSAVLSGSADGVRGELASYVATGVLPMTAGNGERGQQGPRGSDGPPPEPQLFACTSTVEGHCKWLPCNIPKGGTGGAGGEGGAGGAGGRGGGSSIGLYAVGTSVTLEGGSLTIGKGGKGSDGAAGECGAGGQRGMPGAPQPRGHCRPGGDVSDETKCAMATPLNDCGNDGNSDDSMVDGGPPGGDGQPGGRGGRGGGGAGGDSIAFVSLDATIEGALTVSVTLGAGGAAGLPNGQTGRAERELPK
ncbi:MAG: hypothetical protein KIT84_03935 [Labilithrix sp.]|nr:hypothetical protein [Labilithrix sp.]MCW5810135.1 hypothetical protein [Labilithrix sp.]